MQVVQVYFVYMDRRNPSQEWGVNYANRNKLWHFLTAIIWGLWWIFGKDKNLYIFALFCFVSAGDFQVQDARGGLYPEGRFYGGFFALRIWGLIFRGAYFQEFYSTLRPWVMVRPRVSNLQPPALQSSALPTELILPQLKGWIIFTPSNETLPYIV